jgi:low affinity Fe/Cu permease
VAITRYEKCSSGPRDSIAPIVSSIAAMVVELSGVKVWVESGILVFLARRATRLA